MTDSQLLADYAHSRSQEAFSEIVRRHAGTVYETCLRSLGSREDAEDAAQAVFMVLMRKAKRLRPGTVLSGWLYRAARLAARDALKLRARRRRHEREAAMAAEEARREEKAGRDELRPHLDAALATLPRAEMDAVVLRYLRGRSPREVAEETNCSPAAAAKRLTRGLSRLRRALGKRGVALSAAALGDLLVAGVGGAAPVSVVSGIETACFSTASAGALAIAEGTMKAMLWIKLKLIATVACVSAAAVGGGGFAVRHLAAVAAERKQKAEDVAKLKEQLVKGNGKTGRYNLRPLVMCKLGKLLPPEELVRLLRPYVEKPRVRIEERNTAALVLGKFGAAKAVPVLSVALKSKDRDAAYIAALGLGLAASRDAAPPLVEALKGAESSVRYRAAKSLGMAGGKAAEGALVAALEKSDRCTRHAATLGLALTTGEKGLAALKKALSEKDPLIRRGAAKALLARRDAAALAAEARKVWDAPVPATRYRPRNRKLAELADNTWVKLGASPQEAGQNETQWCYDEANRLLFRQSGCFPQYSTECWALDIGTMTWVKRRPLDDFYTRLVAPTVAPWKYSCLVGTCYDPHAKVVRLWGGTWGHNQYGGFDLAADEYVNLKSVKARWAEAYNPIYDLAGKRCISLGGVMNKEMHCWNPHTGKLWNEKTATPGPGGKFPRYPTPAAVYDPVNKVVVCFSYTSPTGHYSPTIDKRGPTETWIYDPAARTWRNARPKGGPATTEMWGALAYDSLNRAIILSVGSSSKKAKLGTGTWRYEVETNTWTDLKPAGGGPGGGLAVRMSFDPEHNVCVGVFRVGHATEVWAYRYKKVAVGTRPVGTK